MSKTQGLFIESKLGKRLQKLGKWGNNIHYFESGKHLFSYPKSGEEDKIVILKVGKHISQLFEN